MPFYTVPSASGGGGGGPGPWTRVGTNVILTNIGDFVGIGVAVPTVKLEVAGTIKGTVVIAGDLHLQDEERNAHWVLREEKDRIVAVNKITGKRYKISMQPIEEDENLEDFDLLGEDDHDH